MIPDHLVDEVRARADLVDIIGERIPLKRAGKEFRALCPFHHEKTPSFYVVPAKGIYKCFGCGAGGDAFSFLMKREGLSFNEAVRHIAQRVGVDIPEESARTQEEPHRAVYEAVAFAADYYQRQLWDPAGERARAYLAAREISREMAERFGLGYAPDAWRSLREAARYHGISDEILLSAGLIKESERAEEPYDRMRDRLIFPIGDVGGRWIAFGGRILGRTGEGRMKYLNSPETPIYQKGRTLYGLNWSRNAIRRDSSVLIVEGYMDFVSLAARGVDRVVAGLGTALTEEQAQLLARYARQAILLYDSDPAGLKATFRAGDELLRAGIEPLVVSLPAGEDPDSLVRKGGAAALAPYLARATDVLERKLEILRERHYFEDIEGMRRALDRLLPTLRAAADPALKDIYVARVAEQTGVRRETLERELTNDRPFRGVPPREPRVELERERPVRAVRKESHSQEGASERLLLILLLRDPGRLEQAQQVITPADLQDPALREVFEAMLAQGGILAESVLSVPAHQALARLQADPQQIIEGDRTFDDAVAYIRAAGLQRRLDEIDAVMAGVSQNEQHELNMEKASIAATLRELGAQKGRLGHKITRYRRQSRKKGPRPSPGGNG